MRERAGGADLPPPAPPPPQVRRTTARFVPDVSLAAEPGAAGPPQMIASRPAPSARDLAQQQQQLEAQGGGGGGGK
jgi:hypothetical protein